MSSFTLEKLPIKLPKIQIENIQKAHISLARYDGMIILLESPIDNRDDLFLVGAFEEASQRLRSQN